MSTPAVTSVFSNDYPVVVYFDVESTGLDPNTAEIIEIGAVVHEEFDNIEFHERIKPRSAIPADATNVHGIRDSDVAKCRSFEAVIDAFNAFLEVVLAKHQPQHRKRVMLVAHNGFHFDFPLLASECARHGRNKQMKDFVLYSDSMAVLQQTFHQPRAVCGLATLYRELVDKTFVQTHCALDDARILRRTIASICHQQAFFKALLTLSLATLTCPVLTPGHVSKTPGVKALPGAS